MCYTNKQAAPVVITCGLLQPSKKPTLTFFFKIATPHLKQTRLVNSSHFVLIAELSCCSKIKSSFMASPMFDVLTKLPRVQHAWNRALKTLKNENDPHREISGHEMSC